jgi:hypothetical protein
MISTEERIVTTTPTTTVPAERPDTRSWLADRVSTETAVLMGATWYVLFMIGTGLEPRAAGPDPAWAVALGFGFLGVLAITAAGLLVRRRWGLLASLGAAGVYTAFSVACPISGHHGLAAWWFGQMACALILVGASAFALARARA